MRSFRRVRVLMLSTLLSVATAVVVGACVGDDPLTSGTSPQDDAATDTATGNPLDSSTGSDGTVPPSDGAATDAADAAPWTPAALDQANNLALWLEASSANLVVSNGAIGLWKDLSKNKNDAKDPSGGPSVNAGIAGGGHDSVHFSQNVVMAIDDAASLQFGTQQFYVAAVARFIPGAGHGYLFTKASSQATGGGAVYASGFELFAGGGMTDAGTTAYFPTTHITAIAGNQLDWGDAVFDDSKFHLVAVRRNSAFALAMTVDDQPARQIATGSFDVSEVGQSVLLGGFKYGSFNPPVDFDIAELVVVHGATAIVGDGDVASLHAYLKKKYAL